MINTEYRQLLCTFTNSKDSSQVLSKITDCYNIYNNRLFVFCNANNVNEVYITYNVSDVKLTNQKVLNTILIHRKKQTNTLYTLNAMNCLIKEETGTMDKTFVVNWNLYENSLIITGDISVRIIPLKILQILGRT